MVFGHEAILEMYIIFSSPSLTSPANCPHTSQTHLRAIAADIPSVTLNNLNFSVHVSPHGREKRIMQRRWPTCPGITPRWAGCHLHAYRITILSTTHPRVSGENSTAHLMPQPIDGSSPRGRGKQTIEEGDFLVFRLIRARAGKTEQSSGQPHSWPVHPRAGGENRAILWAASLLAGSSPRGRGKRRFGLLTLRASRLIPARAGKPGVSRSRLMRVRLIPARAGKTRLRRHQSAR